jgi:hypothetical protein
VRATALGALARLGALDDDRLRAAFDDPTRPCAAAPSRSPPPRPRSTCSDRSHDPDPGVVEVAAWASGEHERVSDAELASVLELAGGAGRPIRSCARRPSPPSARSRRPWARRHPRRHGRPPGDPPPRAVLALAPFVAPDHPAPRDVAAALAARRCDHDWQVRRPPRTVAG